MRGRDNILKAMGYASYQKYLESPLWADIRQTLFGLKGRRCVCCGERATCIHHSSYTKKALSGESIPSLMATMHPICHKCHETVHFKNGKFRTLYSSKQSLKSRTTYKLSKRERRLRRDSERDRKIHEEMLDR